MYLKEKHHELHPKHLKGISIKFRMWLVIILIIINLIFWWYVLRLSGPPAQKTVMPPGKIQIIKPGASPSETPAQYTYAPGAATPGAPEPGTAAPGVTTPGVTEPGTAAPGVTAPGVTAPGVTAPGVTTPGAPEPGTAAPGASAYLPETPLPVTPMPNADLSKIPLPNFKNLPPSKIEKIDFPAPDPIPAPRNPKPDGQTVFMK